MIRRPKFSDLTPEQQAHFGNGIGPGWLPARLRAAITGVASWYFQDASWRHHDFGYAVGGDRWDRARCDWKFFAAMFGDAVHQSGWRRVLIPAAILTSATFYAAVRIGGEIRSFEYRDGYASLDEVLAAFR